MFNSTEQIFKYSIPLCFAFPLFKESISSILFIVVLINTVFYYFLNRQKIAFDKKILFLIIPFGIVLIKSILNLDFFESLNHIKHSLFFLLFPLVFSIVPKEYFKNFETTYITIFKISCLIIIITYFSLFIVHTDLKYIFHVSYNDSEFRKFVYYNTPIFKIHPAYFSTYLIFGITHSLLNFIKKNNNIEFIFIIPFVIATLLLLTKLNIILLFIVLLYFLLFKFNFNYTQKILLMLVFFSTSTILFFYIPGLKERFYELANSFNKPPVGLSFDSTNIRKCIFDCSLKLLQDNYLTGTGFSNIQNSLNNCYKENYQSNFYFSHNYLTHNYFLYVFISSGILGFSALLYFFLKMLTFSIKENKFLLNIFLTNTLLMCLIEDYFYRHYGVFFFLLFFISFYKNSKKIAL